jgi:hypothetical protein
MLVAYRNDNGYQSMNHLIKSINTVQLLLNYPPILCRTGFLATS